MEYDVPLPDLRKDSIYVSIFIFVCYFCRMIKRTQLTETTDSPLYQGRRKKLVKELQEKNICNNNVLDAISAVPRHIFVEPGLTHLAYYDQPLPIATGQTISQPSTVALQSHLLGNIRGKKVLEIGTGCGYQTAVLAQMGAKVSSIERQKELCKIANANIKKIGYENVTLYWGDGYKGIPANAPFDAILVTCGAETVPETLLMQLAVGGNMVIPVGENNKEQEMLVITRRSENEFDRTKAGKCSFVPMLEGVVK